MGFIEDDWLHSLDYSSLKSASGQFVSEDLRLRNNDILWRVRVGGDWVYLYLLLEFQSSVDRFMALRINAYLSLLYQSSNRVSLPRMGVCHLYCPSCSTTALPDGRPR